MPENQFISNSLENNLLISIRSESILYSVTDENEQVLLRQEINMLPGKMADATVYEHFFNQPELNILSENVLILIENSHFQLIPDELFREENMRELFELEFGKMENSKIKYILLPKWGVHLVYRVPCIMIDFFEGKYPDAIIEHHISGLLKKKINKSDEAVFAYLRKDTVDVLVVKDNLLQLVNSFDVKTTEDCCYFVLNVYEQLQLNTESMTLVLMSENSVNEEIIGLLKKYIVTVKVK